MASSCYNSSTPVSPLEISFNTISCFSNHLAYPPNAPWCSKWIHQRGHSSPRSLSSTIQSGWTVSPVSGPSIVSVNNDPNWEDAPTTNPITNTANRPTSSTRSWSKLCWSNDTNEQLAYVLGWLANTLNSSQTPGPNTNVRGTKAYIPDTFSSTVLWNTLDTNIFLFLLSIFLNFIFLFLFLLVTMKRHVTLQSHDMSHDVMS